MPEFAYKARNAQGGLVEGVLNCPDRSVAIRQIEQQNCIPIRIDAVMTAAPIAPGPTPPRNFVPKIFNRGPSERADVPAQKLKGPAQPVARLYRTAGAFATGGNDPG